MSAFAVTNLVKKYGSERALDGITLEAEEGKVFGLLGPNGAGKTTLVRALSTLVDYDKGSATVLGIDVKTNPKAVREVIGLAGQYAAVDEYLTGRENLYMVGRLYHLSHQEAKARASRLLRQLSLEDAADRPVRTYSGGMRRRLDLGASLVGHPKVLFLDEPTTGLDPRTRIELWGIIQDLVKQGTSIILTTQYLEEADQLADKIAVIDKGKVIAEGTSAELKERLGSKIIEFEVATVDEQIAALAAIKDIAQHPPTQRSSGLGISLPADEGAKTLRAVMLALNKAKIEPTSLSMHQSSLDDVFLSLTGKPTRHDEAHGKAEN